MHSRPAMEKLRKELNDAGIACYNNLAVIYPGPNTKKLIIPGVKIQIGPFEITGFATLSDELEATLSPLFEEDDSPQTISTTGGPANDPR